MNPEPLTLFDAQSQLVQPDYAPEATIQERFEAFSAANPWLLEAMERLTQQMLDAGRTKVGIAAIYEVLRWEWTKATTGEPWRLNNSFRSRFVRVLIDRHPEWVDVFETRRLRSEDAA